MRLCKWLRFFMGSDLQNSMIFPANFHVLFIIFKVTSKFIWIKVCYLNKEHLNKNLIFSKIPPPLPSKISLSSLLQSFRGCCIVEAPRQEAEKAEAYLFYMFNTIFQVEWEPCIDGKQVGCPVPLVSKAFTKHRYKVTDMCWKDNDCVYYITPRC